MRTEVATVIAVLALTGCGGAVAAPASPTPTAVATAAATAVPTAVPTDVPTAAPVVSDGYLGSTIEQFSAFHGADTQGTCTAVNACFGPGFMNAESGQTYEFVATSVTGGIVDGYTMNFANGTSIAAAKAEVVQWLPSDTAATYFGIDHNGGSCALWNLKSRTLGRELGIPAIGDPQGNLGVEFGYVDANLNNVYDPNNVQSATISILPTNPSDLC